VQDVIPFWRGSAERPSCRRDPVQVWSAHAAGKPKESGRSAEHAVAADRFAREIVPFLKMSHGALAAAERQAVRRNIQLRIKLMRVCDGVLYSYCVR
jgi:hypothetical protein